MPLEDFPSGAYAGTDHGVSLAASIQEHFGTSRDGRRAALQHRPLSSLRVARVGFIEACSAAAAGRSAPSSTRVE